MADDWKPGDLAVCVEAGIIRCGCGRPHNNRHSVLKVGQAAKVIRVAVALSVSRMAAASGCRCEALETELGTGLSSRFRKVRPDQHEPCEAEFTKLLNRSRKQVRA